MNKQRVIWNKGAFLTPQHFQCQEDYIDELLQFRFAASHFANWGVSTLSIDEARLANGFFQLRYCAGLLPDGLPFEMPVHDDLPEGRSLEEFIAPTQATLDVFLAIPEHRTMDRNFDLEPGGTASIRYRAKTVAIPDANEGDDQQPIQLAAKCFRLLFEGEPSEGFTKLRIAQVTRNQTGAYVLSPRFIPPLLDLSASDYLLRLSRRLIEILSAKASGLAVQRRQKTRELADFTASEVANFWLLHTVNSHLPELEHIWQVRRGHPDVLFRAMLRLAGALATFSIKSQENGFPRYDHNQLGKCFTDLDMRIRELLETVLPSKVIVIPLEKTGNLIWKGSISDERCLKDALMFLSVRAAGPVEDLIGKFPRLARVSSPNEIERLVQKSLPGISLRHTPAPPAAIPIQLDHQYFSLGQHGPLWDSVVQSRTVNVFVPGEIQDPNMELIAVASL